MCGIVWVSRTKMRMSFHSLWERWSLRAHGYRCIFTHNSIHTLCKFLTQTSNRTIEISFSIFLLAYSDRLYHTYLLDQTRLTRTSFRLQMARTNLQEFFAQKQQKTRNMATGSQWQADRCAIAPHTLKLNVKYIENVSTIDGSTFSSPIFKAKGHIQFSCWC